MICNLCGIFNFGNEDDKNKEICYKCLDYLQGVKADELKELRLFILRVIEAEKGTFCSCCRVHH